MAFTSPKKQFAPDVVPDDLLREMLNVHPPLTLAEESFHQRLYEVVVSYFGLKEKKPEPKKAGELSDEAKRAHAAATEGLGK